MSRLDRVGTGIVILCPGHLNIYLPRLQFPSAVSDCDRTHEPFGTDRRFTPEYKGHKDGD